MTIPLNILEIIKNEIKELLIPKEYNKIYKDECVLTFDNPFKEEGIFLNIKTLLSYSFFYYINNSIKTKNKLYLNIKYKQILLDKKDKKEVEEEEEKKEKKEEEENPVPIILGLDIIGGFQTKSKYSIEKEYKLVVIDNDNQPIFISLDDENLPEYLVTICNAIIEHKGMNEVMQVNTWQADQEIIISKHADNLIQLDNGKKISNDPQTWRCELSGETSNLWLNLSTGYIGGGRKHWDGSGGSGAALKHYEDTGRIFPLCVKLGTITPHGADVWSYDPDEDCLVTVPRLGEYLSHWGIDIMKLEKTDLSLGETEVKKNLDHNWNLVNENGEKFELISAPGCIGLANIGSSCYMNSVLQTIFSTEEFQERYYHHAQDILETSFPTQDPTQDPFIQTSKVATALLSDRYVLPSSYLKELEDDPTATILEKYVIAPRMFKHIISKDSRDFSSSKQQDASEYFQYLLKQIQKYERVGLQTRINLPSNKLYSTPTIFEYELEERYECQITNQVKYITGKQTLSNILEFPIPLNAAINQQEIIQHQERKRKLEESNQNEEKNEGKSNHDEEPKLLIPFESVVENYFSPTTVELRNPSLQSDPTTVAPFTPATKTHRFKYFPKYLMIKLARYYVDSSWNLKKIDAEIPVPEFLDLSSYQSLGGLQSGEIPMPESFDQSNTLNTSNNSNTTIVPDEDIINQITSMGFSLNGAKRAAIATNNVNAEVAMNWVFEHMEDSDFNDPLPTNTTNNNNNNNNNNNSNVTVIDEESLLLLTSFGYTEQQCRLALKETNNNTERAADWLFSHTDDLDRLLHEEQNNNNNNNQSTQSNNDTDVVKGTGKYQLIGIISHRGRNTDHGHYVCHLLKDSKWVLFNDDKVAVIKSPPLSTGFMYLYKSC